MDTHARRKKEKRKRETLSAFIRLGFHLLYSMIKQTWKKRILDEKKTIFSCKRSSHGNNKSVLKNMYAIIFLEYFHKTT